MFGNKTHVVVLKLDTELICECRTISVIKITGQQLHASRVYFVMSKSNAKILVQEGSKIL